MFYEFPITRILDNLDKNDLLPAILFRSARKQCDRDVEKLADMPRFHISKEHRQKIEDALKLIIAKYDFDSKLVYGHPHYESLLMTGCGGHHAGQLLIWRLVLEELMTKSLLRILVATGTVAAGVDFPARTVVITAHSKRDQDGFRVISSAEFQQMSGRAGRRGKDSVGICLVAPSSYCDARVIAKVAKKPPEPLKSAYFASPSTVLNLLRHRTVGELKFTVQKSLASFLDAKEAKNFIADAQRIEASIDESEKSGKDSKTQLKKARRMTRQAELIEKRQMAQLEMTLESLEALKFMENGVLTRKGNWAAELCTGLIIELAQCVEAGHFSNRDDTELTILVGSLCGDGHRRYVGIGDNPVDPAEFEKLEEVVQDVAAVYKRPSSLDEVQVLPDAGLTAAKWLEASDWTELAGILRLIDVAEGDAARLITQTADALHQLSRLKESHPGLAEQAAGLTRQLLRPPLSELVAVAA